MHTTISRVAVLTTGLCVLTAALQASAVVMLVAAQADIPVALHTPSEVKAAVTGNGRADKRQVGIMVQRVLKLSDIPKPADAADALALAICHLWRAPLEDRLMRARVGRVHDRVR